MRKIPIVHNHIDTLNITDVKFVGSRIESEFVSSFENRILFIDLIITTIGSPGEKPLHLEQLPSQKSLSAELNPSDFYYRCISVAERKGASAGWGKPTDVKVEFKFDIGQRNANQVQTPWPQTLPLFYKSGAIRHFSFASEMLGGYRFWKMYKLDYSDPENVK